MDEIGFHCVLPQVWWWDPALAARTTILLVVLAAAAGVQRRYAAQLIFASVGGGSGVGTVFVWKMTSKVQTPSGSFAIDPLVIAGTIAGFVAGVVFGRAISDD